MSGNNSTANKGQSGSNGNGSNASAPAMTTPAMVQRTVSTPQAPRINRRNRRVIPRSELESVRTRLFETDDNNQNDASNDGEAS